MGILMIVAIPAISRTIENSRRDMFADTAKQYINSVKTMWKSDSLVCQIAAGTGPFIPPSEIMASTTSATVSVFINSKLTDGDSYPILLESGGKSSWANKDVTGIVSITVSGQGDNRKAEFFIKLSDGIHGISESTKFSDIKRSSVSTSGVGEINTTPTAMYCKEA